MSKTTLRPHQTGESAFKAILNEEIETARLADAGNGRRQECKSLRLGNRRELAVEVSYDSWGLQSRGPSLVVGLELTEIGSASGAAQLREQV